MRYVDCQSRGDTPRLIHGAKVQIKNKPDEKKSRRGKIEES